MSRDEKRELYYCEECGAVSYRASIERRECQAIVAQHDGVRQCYGNLRAIRRAEDADHE